MNVEKVEKIDKVEKIEKPDLSKYMETDSKIKVFKEDFSTNTTVETAMTTRLDPESKNIDQDTSQELKKIRSEMYDLKLCIEFIREYGYLP